MSAREARAAGAILVAWVRLPQHSTRPRVSPRLLRCSAVLTTSFRQAFNDSNADVRKAVVFCLVDIYMVLGPQFEAHLGELNASQVRCAPFGRLSLLVARFHRLADTVPTSPKPEPRPRKPQKPVSTAAVDSSCRLLLLVVHALTRVAAGGGVAAAAGADLHQPHEQGALRESGATTPKTL